MAIRELIAVHFEGMRPFDYFNLTNAARQWLADCAWGDLEPEDFNGLPDTSIWYGVHRHYSGGISAFIQASK